MVWVIQMPVNTNTRFTNRGKQYCKEEPISTDRSFCGQEYDCQKVEVKRQESYKLSKKALRWVTVSKIRNWTKAVWVRENGCADGQTWVLAHRG